MHSKITKITPKRPQITPDYTRRCIKSMHLGTSGVIWVDLSTFWSDFSDFRMQNQSVLNNVLSDS